ncbi:class II aldolase/adducin family protein [Chitinophaga filiformis]|uniref:Ribulose-5-phosphate 4-epimerase/Fuculose-1-phosphate aldolase n=1 Tax=Chitinophaga filiformis TaxID=104663 RepID=A0A1G7M2C4_CHIFI|nr:class II aldolase/adducin family protein [Chitinophaga filiformis]SDF55813.1 Ribulose-5-phosphate 4-epimerase/Fuculose-1-phosphate aldolase [Chitinophaga filiformis]
MKNQDILQSLKRTVPRPVQQDKPVRPEIVRGNEHGTPYVLLNAGNGDLQLKEWLQGNRAQVDKLYKEYGAILFRGFVIGDEDDFQQICQLYATRMLDYAEPSTPRTKVGDKVYTSTEYPKERSIPFHNEHSYTSTWPGKIWFYCKESAATGGETPIADSALVYRLIPAAVRKRFERSGVRYVRTFHKDIDLSWQKVFGTDSREEVKQYCEQRGMSFQWKDNDVLQTSYTAQAIAVHPVTREKVWFNQAHLFNLMNLDEETRSSLVSLLGEENVPRNSFLGDGTAITRNDFNAVMTAYDEAGIVFPWESGDVLLLDNMRFAHSRKPFTGNRKVLVAMSDPIDGTASVVGNTRRNTAAFFSKKERPQTIPWLRYRLAALYRILAMEKLDEGISGHISMKVPGRDDAFWVNPFGLFFEEVTPDNLITVDGKGDVLEGDHPVNVAGFCIHAALHQGRPDTHCIVHTHSPNATLYASLAKQIQPVNQTSCMFFEDHALYDEYNGPVLSLSEGQQLVTAAGGNHTLLLRNHGTLTMAAELETAAILMIAAEQACEANLMAMHTGNVKLVDPDVARLTRQWIANPLGLQIEFDAYMRKAERFYPDLIQYKPL